MRQRALGLAAGMLLHALAVEAQAQVQVGYTQIAATGGTRIPAGTALFSYTDAAGVLVRQAVVGAAEPISAGRIFVDETGSRTAIALANPSAQATTVTLTLRNAAGAGIGAPLARALGAGQHIALYVDELFPTQV